MGARDGRRERCGGRATGDRKAWLPQMLAGCAFPSPVSFGRSCCRIIRFRDLTERGLALVAVVGEAGVLDQEDGDQSAAGVDGHVRAVRSAVTERAVANTPTQPVRL